MGDTRAHIQFGDLFGDEVHLIARPTGEPRVEDLALVRAPVRAPGRDEVVVSNEWLSLDPYMRILMAGGGWEHVLETSSYGDPYSLNAPLDGGAVGTVIASSSEDVPVGCSVLHGHGWREFATVPASEVSIVDIAVAPAQAYLGVLGMPGLTAYVGLKLIAPVRPGDVVFISSAAGAVGTVAGRVARALGASTVVGSTGGETKRRRLTEELGFDAGIDYKCGDLSGQLAAVAPEGIDVYFDNVGGDHLEAALGALRLGGRVALCGAIARYDDLNSTRGPDNLILALLNRLTLRGFIVSDHWDMRDEYVQEALGWMRDGSLQAPETVVTGLANAPEAFIQLLRGANVGKMLVRL